MTLDDEIINLKSVGSATHYTYQDKTYIPIASLSAISPTDKLLFTKKHVKSDSIPDLNQTAYFTVEVVKIHLVTGRSLPSEFISCVEQDFLCQAIIEGKVKAYPISGASSARLAEASGIMSAYSQR